MKNGGFLLRSNRESNIELYRIIIMLMIIGHHYVVNSGLKADNGPIFLDVMSTKSIFLLLVGAWGKIGINCFVFITGYYMCTSNITIRKFIKLFCEVLFYRIVLGIIFFATGYETITIKNIILRIFPITIIETNFVSCFLIFYLTIPFLNILIRNLTEKKHFYLLLLSFFTYVFLGTAHLVTFNYVSWFIIVYLIAAFVRLYPHKIYTKSKIWLFTSCFFIVACSISVIICSLVWGDNNPKMSYFFVNDSNTLLAILTAISTFLLFKNIKIKNSRLINTISSTTFGVLLIHADSDAMRKWLWGDILRNTSFYYTPWIYMHFFVSVLGVFSICSLIDFARIKIIEIPFLKFWDRYENNIVSLYKKIETKLFKNLD